MATTSPARIDDDLYASAQLVGELESRSASQQVVHWARIGSEVEASGHISARRIAHVLGGSHQYDELDAEEQALVRSEWAERIEARRRNLDLSERFASEGRDWVELDADGHLVTRGSGSSIAHRNG